MTSGAAPVVVAAVVTIASVAVAPTSLSLGIGDTGQFSATAKDSNGNAILGVSLVWRSSNPAVASIDNSGKVTGVATGTTQITAATSTITSSAVPVTVAQTQTFSYYKRNGTTTAQTATLSNGVLSIDGKTISGVFAVTGGSGATSCLAGGSGGFLTLCFSPPDNPHTMLLCGPDFVSGAPDTLLYVLFDSPDPQNVSASAASLLNALQSETRYLGIGVFTDCSGSAHTAWIRNYPNTNYYLWPDVFTTYSSAYVSGLLGGAVISSTPTAGNNYYNYAVVRSGPGVFEVWH